MRQGQQNRRGRGRNSSPNSNGGTNNNNNRRGQNPVTRSFESNGPDIKIRGTPAHIADKYISLARDAQGAGDPVLAENYLQHAEHYNRIILAYNEQQALQGGDGINSGVRHRVPSLDDGADQADEFGEGEDGSLSDRAAAGPIRGQEPQPRVFDPNGDQAPHVVVPPRRFDENRGNRAGQAPGQDRNGNDRNGGERYGQERNGNGPGNGNDRNGHDRNRGRNRYQDRLGEGRQQGGDRPAEQRGGYVQRDRGPMDRPQGDRAQSDRQPSDRHPNDRPLADRAQGERSMGYDRTYNDRNQAERARQNDRTGYDRAPSDRAPSFAPPDLPGTESQHQASPVQPILQPILQPVLVEQALPRPDVPAPRADAVSPRVTTPRASRSQFGEASEQPEFLRRPVRRPRREPVVAAPLDEVPALPSKSDIGSDDGSI